MTENQMASTPLQQGSEAGPALGDAYPPGFYAKLAELLGDPLVRSVMYRGHGDRRVMNMMACEQLSRAAIKGCKPAAALTLNVMAQEPVERDEWGAAFGHDTWAYGDLMIDGADLRWACAPIKSLVEVHGEHPRLYAITTRDEGPIDGFAREAGAGWTLYRKTE